MDAFPDTGGGVNPTGDTNILTRNHENREHSGEIPVRASNPYYPTTIGGCTKLVVRRTKVEKNADGQQLYEHEMLDSFNVIGVTSTNCVDGETQFKKCSPNSIKHDYNFGNGEKEAERWPSGKRLARRSERTRTFTKISWTRL